MAAHWIGFLALVAVLLCVDLLILERRGRPVSLRAAWLWTGFLALLAAGFALWLGASQGRTPALEFSSGYLIETSLSLDNLFIFLLLFRTLRLEPEQQRRVLMWGVLGAIVLRGVLILAGATLLARFTWMEYVLGALLAFAALRLLLARKQTTVRGPVRWIRDCCLRYVGDQRLALRSLLLVILAIEATDLVFALDSIPAVLAVTRNPYVAFTSNIFAVLGLRSLYFVIAGLLDRFRLLHYALATILAFVSFRMLAAKWVAIPAAVSLLAILSILAIFALLSRALQAAPAGPSASAH